MSDTTEVEAARYFEGLNEQQIVEKINADGGLRIFSLWQDARDGLFRGTLVRTHGTCNQHFGRSSAPTLREALVQMYGFALAAKKDGTWEKPVSNRPGDNARLDCKTMPTPEHELVRRPVIRERVREKVEEPVPAVRERVRLQPGAVDVSPPPAPPIAVRQRTR